MKNQYKCGKRHGYWANQYTNFDATLRGPSKGYKVFYKDGKPYGYWESLMPFTLLCRKEFYI